MTPKPTYFEQLQRIERNNADDRATRVELAVIRGAILEMIAMGNGFNEASRKLELLMSDKAVHSDKE